MIFYKETHNLVENVSGTHDPQGEVHQKNYQNQGIQTETDHLDEEQIVFPDR